MFRPPTPRLSPTSERRLAERLADDAEGHALAAYQRTRELARLLADAAARADSLRRLETALRSGR